jgi:hypothetical protein
MKQRGVRVGGRAGRGEVEGAGIKEKKAERKDAASHPVESEAFKVLQS